MLEGFKRWISGSATGTAGWEAVAAWAEAQRASFRGQQGEGFVVDGRAGAVPWRLEWGASQRPYFPGGELRLRAEPGVDGELQLLVITRGLQEALERAVFEQYVEDVQTRIDNQTPAEMRWLVMLPKLAGSEMPALREHYAALGNSKPWLQAWLRGGLTQALAQRALAATALAVAPPAPPAITAAAIDADSAAAATTSAAASMDWPLVLMLGRGRLVLRCALDEPAVPALRQCLALFETALREARRAQDEVPLNTAPRYGAEGGSASKPPTGA